LAHLHTPLTGKPLRGGVEIIRLLAIARCLAARDGWSQDAIFRVRPRRQAVEKEKKGGHEEQPEGRERGQGIIWLF